MSRNLPFLCFFLPGEKPLLLWIKKNTNAAAAHLISFLHDRYKNQSIYYCLKIMLFKIRKLKLWEKVRNWGGAAYFRRR
jgi:hypothetical protein